MFAHVIIETYTNGITRNEHTVSTVNLVMNGTETYFIYY